MNKSNHKWQIKIPQECDYQTVAFTETEKLSDTDYRTTKP